jgi:choline monooxygenase
MSERDIRRREGFEVEGDIRRAWTAPAELYSDPDLFTAVRERVFARSWQHLGNVDAVRVPGAVDPVTLLPGLLDEPLLLARGTDDTLRCLSNVCTHRGNLLVEAGGHCNVLRCRYHGRRFRLDGSFLSMPEFDDAEGFPSPADDLPRLPLATWGPLAFTNLGWDPEADPGAEASGAFGELAAPLAERMGWLPLSELTFDPTRSRDYLVRASWALYVENYLEGFHIPYVHAALSEALDYGSYTTELFPRSNLQLGVAADGEDAFDLPKDCPDHGRRIAAYYWWLFPNTMLNVYPWGVSVNVVQPLGLDRAKVLFRTYVHDPSRLDAGAGTGLDRVEREDEAIVEAVQKGVRSRLYHRGRYSPKREQGVHHFHRLLAEALG